MKSVITRNKTALYEDERVRYEIKEGILFARYKVSGKTDSDDIRNIIERRFEIQDGETYSVIAELSSIPLVTKDARELLLKHRLDGVRHLAFVSTSFMQSFVHQLILRLSNWGDKFIVFNDRESAVKWVREKEEQDKKSYS